MLLDPQTTHTEQSVQSIGQRWYVVQSKPKAEREACEQLRRQGYVVELPALIRPRKRWEALFPRYMFLQAGDAAQSIAPVRYTLGVSQLVRFGNQPATVPYEIVQASMHMAAHLCGQDEVTAHGLLEGTHVEVIDGPLKGLSAMVKASAQDRVLILLEIMGREVQVQTRAKFVKAA